MAGIAGFRGVQMGLGCGLAAALLSACQPAADSQVGASGTLGPLAASSASAEFRSVAASSAAPAAPATPAQLAANAVAEDNAKAAPAPEQVVLGLLATAAGLHALSEHCGQLNADARRAAIARLKTRWVGEGVQHIPAQAFDGAYDTSYAETKRRIDAQPERAKQACGELPALEQQAKKALQVMGEAPR